MMLVAFVSLSLIVNVISFFSGAIVASSGVQHVWVGVRAVVLLLAKRRSLFSSSTLQSMVVSVVLDSGVGARSGRVVVAFWLGA